MDAEQVRLLGPYSFSTAASSMSSRSDSLNSVVIPGRGGITSREISIGANTHRNSHQNKRSHNRENFRRDFGKYQGNNNKDHKQFRDKDIRGHMHIQGSSRDHGQKIFDNAHWDLGPHQNRMRRNSNTSSSSLSQNSTECKYYVCPGCKLPYNYFKNRNILCGRLPRVLGCQHTVCEDCINKSIKTTNHICCPICSENTNSKNHQDFDYNHFIVGHITCARMNPNISVEFSNVSLVSSGLKLQGSLSDQLINKSFKEKCGLGGCSNPGIICCSDCSGVYCSKCDEALHNSGKHLISHKRKIIKKVTFELKKCPEHLMLDELYCVNCDVSCCCYCFLEQHEGHSLKYLIRLNEVEEVELKNAYITASGRLEELLLSQKKIEKPNTDTVYDVEIEIARCFTDIHAKLYLIEKKLREKARQESNMHSNLSEVNEIISSNIDTLKYLMMCVDNRSEMKLNLRGLLQKFKEMEKIPSFIVINEGETETKLVIDEKVEQLESYFKLEIPNITSYKLVTTDELPDNYKKEDTSALQENEVGNSQKQGKPSQNKALACRSKVKPAKFKRVHRNEFEQQTVYITHMHSLNCFYVQFKKEDEQFRAFMQEIRSHVEKIQPGVEQVQINELYMAPCLANKTEWGRVRVLEEMDVAGDIKYKVRFIDFGNGKIVDNCELKYISSSLANRRPFAVECRLENLSDSPWTKNSHLQLANLLDGNKEVIMFTKEFSNNIYTVDLNIITSRGDLRSVTDLLVFGYDALQANSNISDLVSPLSKQIFDNSDTFVTGESYEIYLRYVFDPWNIYVQKASYEQSLSSLISSMEKYYDRSMCDIHLPIKDSDVVIFYPSKDYGNWHRARINEVFNSKKVVCVFLVDWGKRVNVSWKHLRNLVELFRTTECLVVNAKLADVGPQSKNGWSNLNSCGARAFLEKYSIKDKPMKMLVSEKHPLEIVLFEDQQTYDDNVNALLVEHGLACSTGKLSETAKWLHKSKEEEKLDENEYLSIYKNYLDDDDCEEELQGVKSQVEIVRFDDPHSIYVSFVSMKAESEQLHEELQIHYLEKYDVQETWDLDDKVVVFNPLEKLYYRGRIQIIDNDLYYIYLLDKGEQICVSKRELRRISTYFSTNFPNSVFKCHLANIKPAGDSNKWSFMSIEWFQKLFEKYKDIYVKKVSDDKTRSSMPVTMWYSKIQQGTALEPSFRKFISIDKKVVKAGLAFHVISDEAQREMFAINNTETKKCSDISETFDYVEKNENFITLNFSQNLEDIISSEEIMESQNEETEEEISIECEIKEWLVPLNIKKKEFYAYVTCAEAEGYLFIRDQDLQPLYKEMEDNMKKHFDSIPKAKPFDIHQNQLVSIWSHNFWYRGVILSVIDKTTAKVMMVDFGSDHLVKTDHLHNKIMYPEVPVMVSKIKLYDVHSKTPNWSESDIDTLLSTVSEYSRIVIRGSLKVEIPLADVYDDKGICLNNKIVKFCPNLYRNKLNEDREMMKSTSDDEQNDVQVSQNMVEGYSTQQSAAWSSLVEAEDGEMRRTTTDYSYVKLPKLMPGKKVLMDIISVWDHRTVSIFVGNIESKEEEFASLFNNLQEQAPDLESLEYFEIGMPCISLFQDDNQWYRAKILQIDQHHCGYVTVVYVDYGNFDIVKVSDLKPVKPEWLNFPATFHVALLDYQVVDKNNECYLLKHLQELVGKSKLVEIVKDQPLTIHIYEEETEELYYDIFVENGVIELNEEDRL